MLDLYTSVIIMTILLTCITIADALSNRLITQKTRVRIVMICLLIAFSALGECIGVLTNGASTQFIHLHIIAKLIEFCCAPAIGIVVALSYGAVSKPKIGIGFIVVHALFECIGLWTQWVFSIDSLNVYHREKFYLVYVIAFIISVIYCFTCIIRRGKEYHTGIDSVLVLTLFMIIVGIGIQFIYSNIRIDFLCIAIGNILLYTRYYKMILQVDAVTSLLNRKCYDNHIGNIGSQAVIIYFDINNFKQVNDCYGHSVGDICLKRIANELRNVYGRFGYCYRIGGDEFCVILISHFDDIEKYNHEFIDAMEKMKNNDDRMTDVALGYAFYNEGVTHIQKAIEEADAMMYHNKQMAYKRIHE